MRRPAAIGTVVALFLVGVVVGALGAGLFFHHRVRSGGPAGAHAMEAERIRALEAELKQRVHLRPDQDKQVDAILADTHRETWALFQEVRPRIAAVVKRSQDRIGQILDPEQRQEYDRYLQERAHVRAEHRHHGAHGAAAGDASGTPAGPAGSTGTAGSGSGPGPSEPR